MIVGRSRFGSVIYTESLRFRIAMEGTTFYLEFHKRLERFDPTKIRIGGSNGEPFWIRLYENTMDDLGCIITKLNEFHKLSCFNLNNSSLTYGGYDVKDSFYGSYENAFNEFKKEVPMLLFELNEN